MVEMEENVPCTMEIYTRAVIINTGRNAPTELNMEGFVMSIIWKVSSNHVDPDCHDVKFSNCYYYCQMLRTDTDAGGEGEGKCLSPLSRGWNSPRLAKSQLFSLTMTLNHGSGRGDGGNGCGLVIVPRPQTESALK
jgi:hypothetical protein